jgi:hypothetical protein
MNVAVEKSRIEAIILSLMMEVQKLAPHPKTPDYKGPVFVQIGSQFHEGAEYDATLGSMLMDGGLSAGFNTASGSISVTDAASIDPSMMVDAMSEYMKDRCSTPSVKIGKKHTITSSFNAFSDRLMDQFLADLPKRQGLEGLLAYYWRLFCGYAAYAPAPSQSL